MNEREKALDKILREYGCCDIEFRESLLEAIMELFRNEEKKGGEQGSLHRVVGATVGADGGQRKCPREGCDNGWIWDQVEPIEGPWPCPTCKGAGVVEYTVAIERSDTGAAMKPSGSPPLGPQVRSIEEELKGILETLANIQQPLSRVYAVLRSIGYQLDADSDGERSEHAESCHTRREPTTDCNGDD